MGLKDWLIVLVAALALTFVLKTFVFELAQVRGESMSACLHNGNRIYVEKLVFRFRGPQRGDIVMCYYTKFDNARYGKRTYFYIKRVIGLPGDTVRIEGSQVYINDELYDEPYLSEKAKKAYVADQTYQVPQGQYFVMGDNRGQSEDSTDDRVGFIPRQDILGRGLFRLWPLDQISSITN